MNHSKKSVRGLSLVELLIAMVIGLFVVGIAATSVRGQLQTSRLSNALSNVQTKSRMALDDIAFSLRSAGYIGCANTSNTVPKIPADFSSSAETPSNYAPVQGFAITSTGWKPANPAGYGAYSPPSSGFGAPISGTHALLVEGGIGEGAPLLNSTITGDYVDLTDRSTGLEDGRMALVSDCFLAEAFFIQKGAQLGAGIWRLKPKQALVDVYEVRPDYPESARVIPYRRALYFVGDSGRTTPSGDPIRSLFEHLHPFSDQTPQELVEGVEAMVFVFRQRLDDGTIVELQAGDPAINANETLGVRLSLLISAPVYRETRDAPFKYQLAGIDVGTNPSDGPSHPDDRRIRQVFEQTVSVRNSLGAVR